MKTIKSALRKWPLIGAVNAAIKAHAMESDVAHTRRLYQQEISRRGLVLPQRAEFLSALQHRISDRASRLGWPKPLGGLHIFLAYSVHNWESVLPGSLSPFGQVTSFEWSSRGFKYGTPDWVSKRDAMNRQLLAAYKAAARIRPVDVVVGYMSGGTVAPEILQQMSEDGAVITNFCFDDKVHWPGALVDGRHTSPAGIAHAVDLNLTNDPAGMLRYAVHGGLAMFHPEAADPDLHRPLQLPFEYDVSFIGARYGWRPTFIRQLDRLGVKVECFGDGWPNGPVGNEEMKLIYAKSRINLGFGGIGYSRSLMCLKGRDFEVPMSGALYLTQSNPELELVFDIGQEILTYREPADAAATIRELLQDEGRAAGIRLAARARCLRDHTYFVRWSRALSVIGALEPQEQPS